MLLLLPINEFFRCSKFPSLIVATIVLLMMLQEPSLLEAYNCRGGQNGPRGLADHECQQNRRTGAHECLHQDPPPVNRHRLMGCEHEASTRKYWCCPQFCPDGQTQILHTTLFSSATSQVTATTTCNAGTCPTRTDYTCYKPDNHPNVYFPTQNEYCCPPLNSPISGNVNTRTTAFPSSSTCHDQGTDCPFREYLCNNNAIYFSLMTWQCPVTCKRCPPGGGMPPRPPGIIDPSPFLRGSASVSVTGSSSSSTNSLMGSISSSASNCMDMPDCPTWVRNGYCMQELYRSVRFMHCPISCGVGCAK